MKSVFREDAFRPISLLAGLLAFLSIFISANAAAVDGYTSTIDEVELTGRLASEAFKNDRGKTEREIILNLFAPVNVDKDENSGPTRNVTRIQLGLFNSRIKLKVRRLVNRKVRIKGILFYGNKPTHHTVILMDVKEVSRLAR